MKEKKLDRKDRETPVYRRMPKLFFHFLIIFTIFNFLEYN